MTIALQNTRARPAVSVLMPCFNAERYLDLALESILSQTLDSLEIVAVDDGSSDRTASILAGYSSVDSRIRVHTMPKNNGLIAALNAGRALCEGKFVARMDADDIAHRDRLEAQVEFLEKNVEFAGVGAAIRFIDGDGQLGSVKTYPGWDVIKQSAYAIGEVGPSPFAHPTMMLLKRALDEVGWYRPAFPHAEDADLWRRMLDAGFRLTNLNRTLLDYRWHGENVTMTAAGVQTASSLRAALSQRMRQAGLNDPFDGDVAVPLGHVVAKWEEFPRAIRGSIRAVWLRRNIARLLDEDPGLLVDELVATVKDVGWNHRYGSVIWSAMITNLRRRYFCRALACLLLGLRHARRDLLAGAKDLLGHVVDTALKAVRRGRRQGVDLDEGAGRRQPR